MKNKFRTNFWHSPATLIPTAALSIGLGLWSLPYWAFGSESADSIVEAMRQLAERCAVRTYAIRPNGKKVEGPMDSICRDSMEVVIKAGTGTDEVAGRVIFHFGGESYRAETKASIYSDGGDLVDLTIYGSGAQVLGVYPNILAFQDPLRAILGPEADRLKEVFDPSLLKKGETF